MYQGGGFHHEQLAGKLVLKKIGKVKKTSRMLHFILSPLLAAVLVDYVEFPPIPMGISNQI